MCAGAIYLTRFRRVVFAALEPEFGGMFSKGRVSELFDGELMQLKGVFEQESIFLLKKFFKKKRIINNMERWLSG